MDVVKMKQGMSYSRKEKTIILNVFKYFRSCYPDLCVTEIVRRTSKATGCSEKSVFQFRKEESSVEGFKQPSKTKIRKNININSRTVKYDNNVRLAIKNIIYDLKCKHIIPSLSRILKVVNSDEKLPNFSLMTLRRLLFDMGFCYERDNPGSKPVLVEKPIEDNSSKKIEKSNKYKKPDNTNQISKSNVSEPILDSVPNSYPVQPPVSHIHQQNQLYMSNQNHHQILPMAVPQHENMMNNHFQMPQNLIVNSRSHQLHPLAHNMHMKHNFNYMHHGMNHLENGLLPH